MTLRNWLYFTVHYYRLCNALINEEKLVDHASLRKTEEKDSSISYVLRTGVSFRMTIVRGAVKWHRLLT